jgi:SAM-dependent methyltransferase
VELDKAKQDVLDRILGAYADELAQDPAEQNPAITLRYTHSIHRHWRTALRMLPVAPTWSVLDVGTGLGLLPFEMAANLPVAVHGVDIDERFIAHAGALRDLLSQQDVFVPGADIRLSVGDINALDVPDTSVDLLIVRELFQFLLDPGAAAAELYRVIKPGGFVCVSDTDDGLHLTWPPPPASQARLVAALIKVHTEQGRDRQTGRKLAGYVSGAGFDIVSTLVLPEAQYRVVDADDGERRLIVEQLHAARQRVVDAGVLSAEAYDADLAALEAEPPRPEFRTNATILVLGRRALRSGRQPST